MARAAIRVLIVDDQEIAREGLRALLEAEGGFQIVGDATDGDKAVDRVRLLQPDVVLMDVRMRRASGLEATRRIKQSWPRVIVIMVTMYEDVNYLLEAVQAGAAGYLLKDTPRAQLAEAVRTTVAGGALIAPMLLRGLLDRLATMPLVGPAANAIPPLVANALSRREWQVLGLLAQGLSNKEIADQLSIGDATVKTHVERILAKLGVADRTQAAVWAATSGGLLTAASTGRPVASPRSGS